MLGYSFFAFIISQYLLSCNVYIGYILLLTALLLLFIHISEKCKLYIPKIIFLGVLLYSIHSLINGGIGYFILFSILYLVLIFLFMSSDSFLSEKFIQNLLLLLSFLTIIGSIFTEPIDDKVLLFSTIGFNFTRFTSLFILNPNSSAILFGCTFVVLLSSNLVRPPFKYFFLLLLGIFILICDSRAILLSLTITFFTSLLTKNKSHRLFFVILINISIITFFLLYKVSDLSRGTNVSVFSHRDAIWLTSLMWWSDLSFLNKILGSGLNSQVHSSLFDHLSWFFNDRNQVNSVPTLHNIYIQLFIDTGIFAFIILFYLFKSCLHSNKYNLLAIFLISTSFYDNFLYINNFLILSLFIILLRSEYLFSLNFHSPKYKLIVTK